jgi:nucleotide-binding universal stress UspA family protein
MFNKILVPIDASRFDEHPVEIAFGLARQGGGKVVLLHVVDDSFPNPDILSFQLPWADYYAHMRELAEKRLGEVCERLAGGVAYEVSIVRGHPARRIIDYAREEGCDLVVMATDATHLLHHALLGSVTDRVIRLAHCPVLVVRLNVPKED